MEPSQVGEFSRQTETKTTTRFNKELVTIKIVNEEQLCLDTCASVFTLAIRRSNSQPLLQGGDIVQEYCSC